MGVFRRSKVMTQIAGSIVQCMVGVKTWRDVRTITTDHMICTEDQGIRCTTSEHALCIALHTMRRNRRRYRAFVPSCALFLNLVTSQAGLTLFFFRFRYILKPHQKTHAAHFFFAVEISLKNAECEPSLTPARLELRLVY